jgi:hypothetical protein
MLSIASDLFSYQLDSSSKVKTMGREIGKRSFAGGAVIETKSPAGKRQAGLVPVGPDRPCADDQAGKK